MSRYEFWDRNKETVSRMSDSDVETYLQEHSNDDEGRGFIPNMYRQVCTAGIKSLRENQRRAIEEIAAFNHQQADV